MIGDKIRARFTKRLATVLIGSMLAATGFLSGFNIAHAAALTSTNVEPQILYANATVNVTASFTTAGSIPIDGKIKITFPGGYNISGVNSGNCSTMDGAFMFSVSGQTVTLTRQSNGTIQTAAAESCTITGVVNPSSAGATGTYTIQTTNSSNVEIDIDAAVASDTILANTLTSTNVQPASLAVNAVSTATVTFTTASAIPANGKIKVTFPNVYNVSTVSAATCSTMDGTFTFSLAGPVVTINRQNDGTSQPAAAESCTITGVTNPGYSGATGTYTIQTTDSTNVQIDIDGGVASDTITPGALTSTNVEPASLTTGVSSTVTVSFTTANSIANNGMIKVTFPGGFNVTGVSGVACSTMDGSFSFNFTGQTVNINRSGGTTQTPAAETCTINNIVNPSSAGSGGTYTISTATQIQQTVDTDAAVSADTFSAPVATLTSTNVQPASLVAGAVSNVTATFTTASSIPANGKIKVTFPTGFGVNGISGATCSSMDGSFVFSFSGQTVTITRKNDGTVQTAAAETCTLNGIMNPQQSGTTGTYTIQTTDSSNVQIDIDSGIPGDTMTQGALSATNVEPASLVASTTNNVTVSFTTANTIQPNGKIKVTFPAGFGVGGVSAATCSSMDGGFTFGVSGQVVTITRNGGGTPQTPTSAETCTINSVTNPASTGATGTYTIQTTTNTDVGVDIDAAVASDTITASGGALTSTNVQPASLVAGATGTVTITFTTATSIPANGKIKANFPSGFNVTGANNGACSTMDGTFVTTFSGQTVIITRQNNGTIQTAAAESCTFDGIVNPQVSGSTGTYAIQTTDSSNVQIDIDAAVAADTITPGALTSTNVQPASTKISTTGSVTVTFTMANPLENNGYVKVTFPSGFNVSGATGGTCASMDGGFTTVPVGQYVALVRNSAGTSEPAGAQTCTIGGIRNPVTAGSGGTYAIETDNNADAIHDRDNAVTADNFSATSSTSSSSSGSSSTSRTYTIAITSPIAASYTAGDALDITWSTDGTGTISAVNLSYSVDAGTTWTNIVTSTANDGAYSWTIPSIIEESVIVRAQGTDLLTVLASDDSEAFSISAAQGTSTDDGTDSGTDNGSTGTPTPVNLLPAGSFIKALSWNTVYYIDTDGTRRPFLDAQTFFTYATSFAIVMDVEDSYLANYAIGAPMLPKAGAVLVKIQSVSKVYILGDNGELHWITSEDLAKALYGTGWADYVIDVPVTSWSHFTIGSDITSANDWSVDSSLLLRRDQLLPR